MADGKDIFISYHRATMAETLRQIAAELSSRGISSWYDTESPKPGQFTETIEKEIKRCKVFLFIWDDGANNSTWCRDEVLSALEHKKHIFLFRVGPLKTENAELNFRLRSFQRFGGDNLPDQELIQQLAETIADTLYGSRPTWKLVYEQEQQLKELEFHLKREQVSAISSAQAKEQRIAELETMLQQAYFQTQTIKSRLGWRTTAIQELKSLQEKAQALERDLTQEQEWIQGLESDAKEEWNKEKERHIKQKLELMEEVNQGNGVVAFFVILSIVLSASACVTSFLYAKGMLSAMGPAVAFFIVCLILVGLIAWCVIEAYHEQKKAKIVRHRSL